jgi:TetR/AcrR family transcriptional regulator, regulator of cefoperazone and chloramphenicol sensitivity
MTTTARAAILESAVRHFAEHGYEGASLREILRDAGANVAAAHYHFGSKEAVYREAVSGYLSRLSEQRRAALLAIEAEPAGPNLLARLIRAYIEPHIHLCSEPSARDYIRLMARFITEDNELTRRIYTEMLEPVRSLYFEAFVRALPGTPRDTVRRLFSFMVVLMVTAPADSSYQSLAAQPAWPKEPEQLIEHLVTFVTAGFAQYAQHGQPERRPKVRGPQRRTKRGGTASPAR